MRVLLALALSLPRFLNAQGFEVASIRPGSTEFGRMEFPANGRLSVSGFTLKALIQQAYAVQSFQIIGGPGWISSDRFDIEARPESGLATTTREQRQAMLAALLADRFQ